MNRLLVSCLLLAILFCGCKPAQPDPTPVDDFKFSTVYDPIVKCYANSTVYFNLSINVLKGDITKNKLTCTISDYPFGVTVTPQSMLIGQLLGGLYTFDVGNVAPGDYALKITVSNSTITTENHTVILRVLPPIDYAPILAGNYANCFDFCQPNSLIKYASVVAAVADSPYHITISNVMNLGTSVVLRAVLSDKVRIPVQAAGVYTIWGTGTYSKDGRTGHENDYAMLINDSLAYGDDTVACTIHIQK